ncbi:MAG: WbqC family protein [Bacteroidetes bacterium]|nr:WbqC family protein [Bacteroidota bacterium]
MSWYISGLQQNHFRIATNLIYSKRTLLSRYEIAGANGMQILSVPVKHTDQKQALKEVQIAFVEPWLKNHKTALESAYKKSPFYEYYDYKILPVLQQETALLQLALMGLKTVHQLLYLEDIPLQFHNSEIIRYHEDFIHPVPEYPQVFSDRNGFKNNMSVLDLLFNLGPDAGDYLRGAISK